MENNNILVAIPCYNEEVTIGKVIRDFQQELPKAKILVIDNNSDDRTAEIARGFGAKVISEKKQGKGFAVQRAFSDFKEGLMIMVDGDDTYEASDVHKLLSLVIDHQADMAVGNRVNAKNKKALSRSHWIGNRFFTFILNSLFGTNFKDIFSGYRVFNQTYINNTVILAKGFEIESELNIQAIDNHLSVKEVDVLLRPRKKGSDSKLKAIHDGSQIFYTIISLFRDYKPLQFFSYISLLCILVSGVLGYGPIQEYLETGRVLRFPSLIVAGVFLLAALVNFIAGLILSSIKRRHEELVKILNKS